MWNNVKNCITTNLAVFYCIYICYFRNDKYVKCIYVFLTFLSIQFFFSKKKNIKAQGIHLWRSLSQIYVKFHTILSCSTKTCNFFISSITTRTNTHVSMLIIMWNLYNILWIKGKSSWHSGMVMVYYDNQNNKHVFFCKIPELDSKNLQYKESLLPSTYFSGNGYLRM